MFGSTGDARRPVRSAVLALAAAVLAVPGVVSITPDRAEAAGPRPLFQLPFPCGQRWQLGTYPTHDDYDIDMFKVGGGTDGSRILASYGGTVASRGYDVDANGEGGGNYVRINHGNGWQTLYLHMKYPAIVALGERVSQGQPIGNVGNTGTRVSHLHYEQLRDGAKVESWFNGVPSDITDDDRANIVYRTSYNCGDDGAPEAPESPEIPGHSVTGDINTDLVALKTDGTMWLFSNNFVRDAGIPYGDVRQIGHGWNGYDRILAADATGDGYTDLVALKADGTMWLFSNNFARDGGIPYGDVRQIGHGWNNYARIIAADATGDGFTDLVGVKSDGTMWLFSNNFARDAGIPYGDVRQIGHGWNGYDRIIA